MTNVLFLETKEVHRKTSIPFIVVVVVGHPISYMRFK